MSEGPSRAPRPTGPPPHGRHPTDEEIRSDRRHRAIEEPLDVRPRPDSPVPQVEVWNPVKQTRYRVLLPEFPSREGAMCGCADFGRRGVGTCKHLEAAALWIDDHPEPWPPYADPDGTPWWTAIDARLAERSGPLGPRTLRCAGMVLYDGPDAGRPGG